VSDWLLPHAVIVPKRAHRLYADVQVQGSESRVIESETYFVPA
jgi:hypothetical protein